MIQTRKWLYFCGHKHYWKTPKLKDGSEHHKYDLYKMALYVKIRWFLPRKVFIWNVLLYPLNQELFFRALPDKYLFKRLYYVVLGFRADELLNQQSLVFEQVVAE